MSGVFISYRRSGPKAFTYHVSEKLQEAFGKQKVFIDVEKIKSGAAFAQKITDALENSSVALVMIGPNWISAVNEQGVRKLDAEDDWVSRELLMAKSRNLKIIPVLIEGAVEPSESDLPENLHWLCGLQMFKFVDSRAHWEFELDRLVKEIRDADPALPDLRVAAQQPSEKPHSLKVIFAWVIFGLVTLTALTEGWLDEDEVLGALFFMLVAAGLAIAGFLDINKGKTRGKVSAIAAMAVCSLFSIGYLINLATWQNDSADFTNIDPVFQNQGLQPGPDTDSVMSDNYVAPAVQQIQPVQPEPEVTAAYAVDLSGIWMNDDGVTYQIQQSGTAVTFAEYNVFGAQVGQGQGTLVGAQLNFQYYNSFMDMNANGTGELTDEDTMLFNFYQTQTGQYLIGFEIYRE